MTTHDNPNGPCSCGAWHKPDRDITDDRLQELAAQPYPASDWEKTLAIELLQMRRAFRVGTLLEWGRVAKQLADEKGFGSEDSQAMSVMCIALMHQELSEMLEAVRMPGEPMSKKVPSITLEAEELADLFLRLAQYAAIRGIDIDRAVSLKHEYNKSRPYKHGKKF